MSRDRHLDSSQEASELLAWRPFSRPQIMTRRSPRPKEESHIFLVYIWQQPHDSSASFQCQQFPEAHEAHYGIIYSLEGGFLEHYADCEINHSFLREGMSQCLIKHSYQPLLNYRKWIND
jgi:hypothetical protein